MSRTFHLQSKLVVHFTDQAGKLTANTPSDVVEAADLEVPKLSVSMTQDVPLQCANLSRRDFGNSTYKVADLGTWSERDNLDLSSGLVKPISQIRRLD